MSSVFAAPGEMPPQGANQMMNSYDPNSQSQQYSQNPYRQQPQPQQPPIATAGGPVPPVTNPQMGPVPGMAQQLPPGNQQLALTSSSYPATNTAPLTPGTMAPPASIQKLLDENNQYIQLLLDYQSKGQHQQCAEYQRLLHRNLVYLATVADSTNQNPQSSSPSLALMPGAINSSSMTNSNSNPSTMAEPNTSTAAR